MELYGTNSYCVFGDILGMRLVERPTPPAQFLAELLLGPKLPRHAKPQSSSPSRKVFACDLSCLEYLVHVDERLL